MISYSSLGLIGLDYGNLLPSRNFSSKIQIGQ